MNVLLIFTGALACLLALYMMHRFIRRPGVISVLLLTIQLLSTTVIVFVLAQNVLTTPQVELAMIFTGIILPLPMVVYDHIVFSMKRKKAGFNISFIEKKEKKQTETWNVSFFTEQAELWKKEIPAMEVYRSLSVQDEQISENIKKQLIIVQRLINLEHYEAAAERYYFLFSILPGSYAIAYNAGYLYCFIGKYREAYRILRKTYELVRKEEQWGEDFEEIEKKNKHDLPRNLEALIHFELGYALYYLGKYEHAIRHFTKVSDKNPGLTVVYKNIARAYLKIGMEDKALAFLEKGRRDIRDSHMRIVLGSIYYRKGDTKKALEVLDEAVEADAKQIEAFKWKGKAALKEKIYDKAAVCFSQLIRAEPAEAFHYYHLALAQRASGMKGTAIKTYENGLSENPDNSMLLYNYGTLLDEMGQKEKAIKVLYKSLQGDEMMEDTYNYLGVLLGQMKSYRESVQVFEKGIRRFPKSYNLYFNRGVVLEMARRQEDAVKSFEKAYQFNHQDPMLYYHYTATLLKIRDYAKAIRICKEGLSNYPDDAELIYGLSKVYTHMNEKDIAVALLQKVVELDSKYIIRIRNDHDFKMLYRHPGYQSLLVS